MAPPAIAGSPSACLGSSGNVATDSRDLLVTPLSQFSLEILGPATDVRLVIALCSGANMGSMVVPPNGCTVEMSAVNRFAPPRQTFIIPAPHRR